MQRRNFRAVYATIVVACTLSLLGCSSALTNGGSQAHDAKPLLVYCAAGIRLPVESAAKQYAAEFGRQVKLDYGSSGELEGKLEIDRRSGKTRCDLYIPADATFTQRTRDKGLTAESIDLAKFRLVLAVKPDDASKLKTLDDLLSTDVNYVMCDTKAGAGKTTMVALQKAGKWQAIDAQKKASFPRVTEAANAVKNAGNITAGFIWDTTAKQFGLASIELEELREAVSSITVNVVDSTDRPAEALHFARYLAAQDKGQLAFAKFGFEPTGSDRWAETPEIVLYCGGVNRVAIDKTLREFEKREGVRVKEHYGGCGTLVSGITSSGTQGKGMPDAFMTCDVSYMDKVKSYFDMPSDVSSTNVVMLVRKGNPKQLRTIRDLAKPNLAIGTTNPKMSTLGDISWQLFELMGVKEAIERNENIAVTTPTAHELIMQMLGHDKLDVALVYEANCQNLSDEFEIIPIDHERAKAIQNIAAARETPHPALARRLIAAIMSDTSQKRFELQGFRWQARLTNP